MGKLQQDVGILNDSDVLRQMIGETEKLMVAITPASAPALLRNHTEAHALLDKLANGGADMRAERSRLDTIDERIVSHAREIVKATGGAGGFAALREEAAGNYGNARWWRLDDEVAAAVRSRLIKIGVGVGALAVVLLLGFLLRGVLFPPDPVGDALFGARAGLQENDLPRALSSVELGLTKMPTSTTLLVWQGVLLEKMNDPRSADAFANAKEIDGEERFLLERAQVFVQLGENDRVIEDATRAIEINPNSAEAYYIRSSGYEGNDDIQRALDDLDKTATLAEQAGNDTLFATARVRSGTLMQRLMGQGNATATP
jgi:tetratricopeptide (TPR) repeat protein